MKFQTPRFTTIQEILDFFGEEYVLNFINRRYSLKSPIEIIYSKLPFFGYRN